MILASASGDSLELSIEGYEFDSPQADPRLERDDANWLKVWARIQAGAESWSFSHPCLTTWEARNLVVWLELAIHSRPEPIDFTEPNLEFRAGSSTGAHREIVVILRAESAPPASSDDKRWGGGRTLTLQIAPDALAEATRAWGDTVAAYPER